MIRLSCWREEQLFHAPLPLQRLPPVPCCVCCVQFQSDVLQRHRRQERRRACLLVALPIRALALGPAVRGVLAARAALEPHTLLAAVGATLRACRHRRGRAARANPFHQLRLPFAASPPLALSKRTRSYCRSYVGHAPPQAMARGDCAVGLARVVPRGDS